jgi:hypothetical protein
MVKENGNNIGNYKVIESHRDTGMKGGGIATLIK